MKGMRRPKATVLPPDALIPAENVTSNKIVGTVLPPTIRCRITAI